METNFDLSAGRSARGPGPALAGRDPAGSGDNAMAPGRPLYAPQDADSRPAYSDCPHPPEPRPDAIATPAWLVLARRDVALARGEAVPFDWEDADRVEE